MGEGDSNLFNKGPDPLQRGDNHKNVKIGWGHLKIFFSKTTVPISTRLGTNHPWVMGIQVCLKEGDSPFAKSENALKIYKNLLQNQLAKFNQTWYKLFLGKGGLLK